MPTPSGAEGKQKPSCECQTCEGMKSISCGVDSSGDNCCNSVLLRTGQFTFSLPLLSIAGIGVANWSFGLDYLSENAVDDLLGKEFNFPQYEHLVELASDDVDLYTSQNTVERFIWTGSGYSSENNNTAAVLERTGSGESEEFKLIHSGGSITRFYGFNMDVPAPGRLKSKTDRFGNTVTYEWSMSRGMSLLNKVTDGYGRQVVYRYCTVGSSSSSAGGGSSSSSGGPLTRLCEIEDFLGRKLNFQYDDEGRLIAVVLPSILRAAEGNEFPGGTAYVFRYQAALPVSGSSSSESLHPDNLVNIWYPNQVTPYLNTATREVDVQALYAAADAGTASAAPRYTVEYDSERRVVSETVGDPAHGVGGSNTFDYTEPDLPKDNLIDPADTIVAETVMTDRNGNETAYFFNAAEVVICKEVRTNRDKIEFSSGATPDAYVTWTKYNDQNQVLERVFPAGNAVVYEYDDGIINFGSGDELYVRRRGLLLAETRTPGNAHDINAPQRAGSGPSGEEQTLLTKRYFYEPIYNRVCAQIEERGNPINPDYIVSGGATLDGESVDGGYVQRGNGYMRADGAFWLWSNGANWRLTRELGDDGTGYFENGATITASTYTAQGAGSSGTATTAAATGAHYFTPQNGGTTPDNADRSRYASATIYDYQKNSFSTVINDPDIQALLGLNSGEITALIVHVVNQMTATDGTGGVSFGFTIGVGDVNGDGTGDAASLPAAPMVGSVVQVIHPDVRLLTESTGGDPWQWTSQDRVELFTVNALGQATTYTDPEGNVTAYVRYPYNDPEGDGQFIAANLTGKQYGRTREVHADVDPEDVMSLIGSDGDLLDFKTNVAPRSTRANTPGIYQDLTTRYEGGMAAGGCPSCAYDPLGNPLATTDPRGFTTIFERNEMGEVFRTVASRPYQYKVETHYDANRNVIREDTQDVGVQFDSDDPAGAGYAHFTPEIDENAPNVAHVPTLPGAGGEIRPGWFTNLYVFDLLDNMVEQDLDSTGSNPTSLVTQYEYDANENLTKITRPEGNTVQYDYDERNLRIAEGVGSCDFAPSSSSSSAPSSSSSSTVPNDPNCAVTIYFYDRNGNLEDVIGPARRGAPGNELTATIEDAFGTGNTLIHTGDYLVENTYDGFDRVIAATDAVGNVANSIHDPGGRVIEMSQEGPIGGTTPDDRDGTNNVTLTESQTRFDEAGRAYESQQNVFLATGTTLPSARAATHTGGGLEANATTNNHTGTVTLTTGGDSYVLSRTVHDAAGRVVIAAQDNAALTHFEYDGANRQIKATDALGNFVENTYDGNSNVIHIKRTEKCTITEPTVDDEIFEADMYYDCRNRLVVSAAQGADGTLSDDPTPGANDTLFSFTGYDSRDNAVVSIDPKGNSVITVYDGASRPTETHEHLRTLGEGENPPAANQTFLPASSGVIRTITVYDGNSRVKQLVDDRGAPTNYTYDSLDRQVSMVFQDGSVRTNEYNAASDVVTYTDENGSVFEYEYDALGRRVGCEITPASGVAGHNGDATRGTTSQSFEFDGINRMRQSIDTTTVDNANAVDATVNMVYDSLSRVLEDSQDYNSNTRNATNNAFTSFPVTQFTYPQGRQIDNTYDSLYRRTLVEETTGGADIASWEFFGPSRVAELSLGNGLICSHMNNARTHSAVQAAVSNPAWGNQSSDRLGYDGAGRMITKRYLAGGINGETHAYNDAEAVVGFTTEFDKSSNKYYERALHAESRSSLYQPRDKTTGTVSALGYDSIDRLRQYQRGILNDDTGGNVGGCEITTAISLPGTDTARDYNLDGLGNWKRTVFTPQGGSETTQIRDHNHLNQITRTKENSTEVDFSYDGTTGASNGNLQNDGERSYKYDALNRLTEVFKDPNGTPTLIGTYTYDAMGRRIRKVVSNNGLTGDITNGTVDFLYAGWRCMEERDGSNNPDRQYVWGIYIDELIQQRNDPAGMSPVDRYMLSDLLYRGTALTDDTGTIVEAYDTDAYGNTLIFDAAGTGPSWWADDASTTNEPTCQFIFTGRRYDPETQIYWYRARYYMPEWGRFSQRDPLAFIDPSWYSYALGNPPTGTDPHGNVTDYPSLGGEGTYQQIYNQVYGDLLLYNKVSLAHTLSQGCIGVVLANLGINSTAGVTDLVSRVLRDREWTECYDDINKARERLTERQSDDPEHCCKQNRKARLFSFKYPQKKTPRIKDGKVTNADRLIGGSTGGEFDFSIWSDNDNAWWGANQGGGRTPFATDEQRKRFVEKNVKVKKRSSREWQQGGNLVYCVTCDHWGGARAAQAKAAEAEAKRAEAEVARALAEQAAEAAAMMASKILKKLF